VADGLVKLVYGTTTIWIQDVRDLSEVMRLNVSATRAVTGEKIVQYVQVENGQVGDVIRMSGRLLPDEYSTLKTFLQAQEEATMEYYPGGQAVPTAAYTVFVERAEFTRLTPTDWVDVTIDLLITAVN